MISLQQRARTFCGNFVLLRWPRRGGPCVKIVGSRHQGRSGARPVLSGALSPACSSLSASRKGCRRREAPPRGPRRRCPVQEGERVSVRPQGRYRNPGCRRCPRRRDQCRRSRRRRRAHASHSSRRCGVRARVRGAERRKRVRIRRRLCCGVW
jgi:hypothetical protein